MMTFMVFIFMLDNKEDKINMCSIVNAVLDVSKVLTFFCFRQEKNDHGCLEIFVNISIPFNVL